MNKKELITAIGKKITLSNACIEEVLSATDSVIKRALIEGDKVQLRNFGTFETKQRAAKKGRNPQTGETLVIAARVGVKFIPAPKLKNIVNGKLNQMANCH